MWEVAKPSEKKVIRRCAQEDSEWADTQETVASDKAIRYLFGRLQQKNPLENSYHFHISTHGGHCQIFAELQKWMEDE